MRRVDFFWCNHSDRNNVKAQKFRNFFFPFTKKKKPKNASFYKTLGHSGTSAEHNVQ